MLLDQIIDKAEQYVAAHHGDSGIHADKLGSASTGASSHYDDAIS